MELLIGRVYQRDEPVRGYRVLVDRLWPRGIRREEAPWDEWWRDLAPSDALRRWMHADSEGRWEAFARRYREELEALPAAVVEKPLAACRREPVVVLLTASRHPERSHVPVLRRWLLERLAE